MATPLDTQNLIAIRKLRGWTQVESAERLQISTRKYSDYENKGIKNLLSDFQFYSLSHTFKVPVVQFWAELPPKYTTYYFQTTKFSTWADYLSRGVFKSVHVAGAPAEKKMRQPLLDILKVAEFDEQSRPQKLSDKMNLHFKCEDNLEILFDSMDASWNNQNLFVAQCSYVKSKPKSNIESGKGIFEYSWHTAYAALIDFDGIEIRDKPIPVQTFLSTDDLASCLEYGSYDDYIALGMDALACRPAIISGMDDIPSSAGNFDNYGADFDRRNDAAIDAAIEARSKEDITKENG